ncbi:MAG TPA: NAD-dependent epimerase/dehydratase family protein [Azospirillum sp.]|nr:NAD-dependent epimerase/dehydratase family protein [Azospirillum sp.]
MQKFCVLGGGGFIGTNLILRLRDQGADLRAFGHPPTFPETVPGVAWTTGEFDDTEALWRCIDGCDVVYHLMGGSVPGKADADKVGDLRRSVENTVRMLEAARGGGIGKIVFVSSGGTVYGITDRLPIQENMPTDPITAYGVSRLAIEKYLNLYRHQYGIDYTILRVSNPFGEYQTARQGQGLVATLLICAFTGRRFEMWGDGTTIRDYVYVGDVTNALLAAAHPRLPERVFNIGSGTGIDVNEMICLVEAVVGQPITCLRRPSRPVDVPASVLDVSRAGALLGWRPTYAMPDALDRTARWMKAFLAKETARGI